MTNCILKKYKNKRTFYKVKKVRGNFIHFQIAQPASFSWPKKLKREKKNQNKQTQHIFTNKLDAHKHDTQNSLQSKSYNLVHNNIHKTLKSSQINSFSQILKHSISGFQRILTVLAFPHNLPENHSNLNIPLWIAGPVALNWYTVRWTGAH